MKVVPFCRYPSKIGKAKPPRIATLGNFEGVHLGHQALLQRVGELKGSSGQAIVLSFYPHPALVLGKVNQITTLTTLRQKLKLLGAHGADLYYMFHFTKNFSRLSARDFINKILVKHLNIDGLIIGPDAYVGAAREGSPEFINEHMSAAGRFAEIVSFVTKNGERISSGAVREALTTGDLDKSNYLLGRPYSIEARVVRGDGRGKGLGLPTANLKPALQMLPQLGIYATRVHMEGKIYVAATSVGVRPTFNGKEPVVEAYLLSYSGGDFYGKRIEVEFVKRIRDEVKFESVAALKSQMLDDIEKVKEIIDYRH